MPKMDRLYKLSLRKGKGQSHKETEANEEMDYDGSDGGEVYIINSDEDWFECSKCKQWVCRKCAGLTHAVIWEHYQADKVPWFCQLC